MKVTPSEKSMSVSFVQSANASALMRFTLGRSVTAVSDVQPSKAQLPTLVTLPLNSTFLMEPAKLFQGAGFDAE